MTHYGLNPSFVYNSPLPLFGDLVRRAKRVEADGSVKLMENATPEFMGRIDPTANVVRRPSGLLTAPTSDRSILISDRAAGFDRLSLAAMGALRPSVLRTLDWSMANKRTDWTLPRVGVTDLFQGSDRGMAVEFQAQAANFLKCHLWWNAPVRFELTVPEYEVRLEEMLVAIQDTVNRPPVLEYGNELWHEGGVNSWLGRVGTWQTAAAMEIATLDRVARRVFGGNGPLGARPYYLFVGGQLTVPSHLDRILETLSSLGVMPDLAGPALYVTPLKASVQEWAATGAIPSQDELRSSCMARLEEIDQGRPLTIPADDRDVGVLEKHVEIIRGHSVPYVACYEAGQSLIARGPGGQPLPWRRAAIEAQKTEWMGDLYRGIRRAAEDVGVDVLNWYSAATDQSPVDSRVDVFGLLEGTDLTALLPKARAARGD